MSPTCGASGSLTGIRVIPDDFHAAAQARSVAALIEELGLRRPIVGGYDVGSRVAQRLAQDRPDLVGGLVISPPLPGATEVLWPEHDPLFPQARADRIDAFFSAARLHLLDGVGHFTPVEAPEAWVHWLRHASQHREGRAVTSGT